MTEEGAVALLLKTAQMDPDTSDTALQEHAGLLVGLDFLLSPSIKPDVTSRIASALCSAISETTKETEVVC